MFLRVSPSDVHGHGCFATADVETGTLVASSRLLLFPPEQAELLLRTHLKNYLFYLRDGPEADGPFHAALAMGPISFCNHSPTPNCDFALDEAAGEITLVARRRLQRDEEITIDYGDYAEAIV